MIRLQGLSDKMAVVVLPQRPRRAEPLAACPALQDAGRQPSFSEAQPLISCASSPPMTTTQGHDEAEGGKGSPRREAALKFNVVAIGLENSRTFAGIQALETVIGEARREAWVELKLEYAKESKLQQHTQFDGTLLFGQAPNLGAELNSDRVLDELFGVCAHIWKKLTPNQHNEAKLLDLRSLWLQATRGDCDEIEPLEPALRKRWLAWFKLGGLGRQEAKRRYLRLLKRLDANLVVPQLPTAPPPGFPKAMGGAPLCARCNTARGCDAPILIDADQFASHSPVLLASRLSDVALLRGDHQQLAKILDRAVASHCCVHGMHQKLSKAQAKQFSTWFTLPGLGGFLEHRDIDKTTGHPTAFERVAAELHEAIVREHRAHANLCRRDISTAACQSTIEAELSEETRHAARDCQAELCERLRDFWQSWTGRPFIMKQVCSRKTAACVHRRHTVDRTNRVVHKHVVTNDDLPSKPQVSLSASYGAVAELRRGTARLGAPRETGPPSQAGCSKIAVSGHRENSSALDNVDRGVAETALVLAERIAVEHLKQSRRLEAAASLSTRDRLREAKRRIVARAARKKQRSDLVAAIQVRDLVKAIALVAAGAGAHRETVGGVTALMACVLQNDRSAATELAKLEDVDLDYPSKRTGLSALALACKRGSAAMVHHLLDLGASPMLPRKYAIVGLLGATASYALKSLRRYDNDDNFIGLNDKKETSDGYESPAQESDEDEQPRFKSLARHFAIPPCAAAATAGQLVTLSLLLSCIKSRYGPAAVFKMVNQKYGPRNATALHYVVQKRDSRTAMELLANQARLDILDLQRRSPVDIAFSTSSSAKTARRIMMSKTASPLAHFLASTSAGERSGNGDAADSHGAATLSRHALLAHAKLDAAVKALAAASSDLHSLDASQGDSIISAARATVDGAAQKVVDIVTNDEYASLDLETAEGATPLIAAAVASSSSVVGALVDGGCEPNYANKNQRTALMAAAMARNVGAALVLLQRGAEAKRRDLDGRTAACFAKERAAGEFDFIGDENKCRIVDEDDDLLDDLLLAAATVSNEVAIDRFKAWRAIAAATNTKRRFANDDGDNSWQWRLYPNQSRCLGASSKSKAICLSTTSDSPEVYCGSRTESTIGAGQREMRVLTTRQPSTTLQASSSTMKHTQAHHCGQHVSISDAQGSARFADERHLEAHLFRDHPASYICSLKSSYCMRFGAAKLDDLLRGRRRQASPRNHEGQTQALTSLSLEEEKVPPDAETTSSHDEIGSCTNSNRCILSLCCSAAPSISPTLIQDKDVSVAECEAPPLSSLPCKPDALERLFADGDDVEEDDYSILQSDDDVDEAHLAQEFCRMKLFGFTLRRQPQKSDDSDVWRARRERLKSGVTVSEITDVSKKPPPELEYASDMVTKGQFKKAAWTLRTFRRKQRRSTRLDDDARAVALARTDCARADLEEARQHPHRAIRLRRRALATLLRVLGPGDGYQLALSREVERSIAHLARLYCKLGARKFAVGLYKDLGATYATSRLEAHRNFAGRMLAQHVALMTEAEDASDPMSELRGDSVPVAASEPSGV